MQTFEEYWEQYGELHASMSGGNIKLFAKEIWESAPLKDRIEQLEKEKATLYDRCLENEEAMYEAVINGNDNHLIELVEKGVNEI